LVENYKSAKRDGFFQWKKFTDDIMAFVAPRNLEKEPTLVPLKPAELVTRTIDARTSRAVPTPQVDRILGLISKFVVARRISLKERFIDKDPHHHKQVSATAFAQALQLLGIHISKPEIDTLCTFYNDPSTNFVRYPDFIEDVSSLGATDFGENTPTKLVVNPVPEHLLDISRYVASSPKISADQLKWNALLPKIQSFVLKRRLRIVEFFENFDRLRHGTVTMQKFRSVVGQLDLPLTEDEIQFTGKLFVLEGKPDLLNYRLFCDQVNEVFGVTELHRTPSKDGVCRATYLPDPSLRVNDVVDQESQRIDAIIKRMQRFVSTRRVAVRQQFDDYDRAPHRNFITKAQFKQCIGRLGLSSDDDEMELLCKRYRCTDLDEQNYHAFCKDIDALSNWESPI
jgi:Ca2+-binding EF-hand superfamily protein